MVNHSANTRQANNAATDKGMSMKRAVSLQSRLREHYEGLPESERKIAEFILDFPGEVAAYSATELAELSGGSKAAVTRLTRRLGFERFEDARRAARDGQAWGTPVYLMSRDDGRKGFKAKVDRHLEQDFDAMKRTFESLGEDAFEDIVKAICGASRVWFLGYRNNRHLAGYLRWQLIQVRGDVHMLPDVGETLAEYFSDIKQQDLLVVIGFSPACSRNSSGVELGSGIGRAFSVCHRSDGTQ